MSAYWLIIIVPVGLLLILGGLLAAAAASFADAKRAERIDQQRHEETMRELRRIGRRFDA